MRTIVTLIMNQDDNSYHYQYNKNNDTDNDYNSDKHNKQRYNNNK